MERPPVNGTFAGSGCSGDMGAAQKIIPFPSKRVSRQAAGGATLWQVWKGRVRQQLGRSLCWAGIPGALAASEISDAATGQHISITVDAQYVRLCVDGRDYYFDRITGRFDGTGSGA